MPDDTKRAVALAQETERNETERKTLTGARATEDGDQFEVASKYQG